MREQEPSNLRHQWRWKSCWYKLGSWHAILRVFPVRPTLPGLLDINRNLVLILILGDVTVLDVHADAVRTVFRGKQQFDSPLALNLRPPELRIDLQPAQGLNQVFSEGGCIRGIFPDLFPTDRGGSRRGNEEVLFMLWWLEIMLCRISLDLCPVCTIYLERFDALWPES